MATYLRMPKWGSAMQTGTVVCWLKEEGEPVAAGELLLEVETEKINNLVESPAKGVVRKIVAEAGTSYPVGHLLAVITAPEEAWSEAELQAEGLENERAAAGIPALAGAPVRPPAGAGEQAAAEGEMLPRPGASTPAARRLARDLGLDIAKIEGSGPGGRVVQEDVCAALARRTGLRGSRCLLVEGRAVHLLDSGSGPPLVLLHGLGGSAFAWLPVLDGLAKHFRVIVPDLLGFGYSEKPEADYSLEFLAGFLADLLGALGYDRVSLAGNSLGGAVALRFALDHPEQVERLVLADGAALGREVNPELAGFLMSPPEAGDVERMLSLLFHDQRLVTVPVVAETYRQRRLPGAMRAIRTAVQTLTAPDGQAVVFDTELEKVSAPVLVIWGREDRIVPLHHGEQAVARIPDARLVVIEECGHCPQVEQPRRFLEQVRPFLRSDR